MNRCPVAVSQDAPRVREVWAYNGVLNRRKRKDKQHVAFCPVDLSICAECIGGLNPAKDSNQ